MTTGDCEHCFELGQDAAASVTEPPMLSPAFAAYLSMSKQQFLDVNDSPGVLHQEGAAYIDATIELPPIDEMPSTTNAAIETFIVEADGTVTPTGSNRDLIDAFAPAARRIAEVVRAALLELDVEIEYPAYVTASVTPCEQINGVAHFDDEKFEPADGVGFVAIVGDVGGSRVACEPIGHEPVTPGVPLVFDSTLAERFESGQIALHQAEPERLLIFPQFGHLHAGPPLAGAGVAGFRRMLVFRSATQTMVEHVPVAPMRRRRTRR